MSNSMKCFTLKFNDSNLEYEWTFRELINKKGIAKVGIAYYLLLFLYSDIVTIQYYDKSNWYFIGPIVRLALCILSIILYILVYRNQAEL